MSTSGINSYSSVAQRPHGIDSAENNPLAQQHEHADDIRDKTEKALYEDINDARLAKIAAKSILESTTPIELDFESTGNKEPAQTPLEKSNDPVNVNALAAVLAGSDKYIGV